MILYKMFRSFFFFFFFASHQGLSGWYLFPLCFWVVFQVIFFFGVLLSVFVYARASWFFLVEPIAYVPRSMILNCFFFFLYVLLFFLGSFSFLYRISSESAGFLIHWVASRKSKWFLTLTTIIDSVIFY